MEVGSQQLQMGSLVPCRVIGSVSLIDERLGALLKRRSALELYCYYYYLLDNAVLLLLARFCFVLGEGLVNLLERQSALELYYYYLLDNAVLLLLARFSFVLGEGLGALLKRRSDLEL
jgi:hypothetical protein